MTSTSFGGGAGRGPSNHNTRLPIALRIKTKLFSCPSWFWGSGLATSHVYSLSCSPGSKRTGLLPLKCPGFLTAGHQSHRQFLLLTLSLGTGLYPSCFLPDCPGPPSAQPGHPCSLPGRVPSPSTRSSRPLLFVRIFISQQALYAVSSPREQKLPEERH